MSTVHQTFTIHPAGQGLFYTGVVEVLKHPLTEFRFVFDCGSFNSKNLTEEVALFRLEQGLPFNRLDLLVISHFHQDHISHIRKLLDGGVKINKLVMPFVSFTERLYLCLVAITLREKSRTKRRGNRAADDDGGGDGLSGDAFNFLLQLTLDPLSALADNLDDGSEVVFITSPGDAPFAGEDRRVDNPDRPFELNELRFDFPASSKVLLTSSITQHFSPPPVGVKVSQVTDDVSAGFGDVSQVHILMEFIFYRRSIGSDEAAFYSAVYDSCLAEFGLSDKTNPAMLRDLLQKALLRLRGGNRIEKIFKQAKKGLAVSAGSGQSVTDLNTTALCLLHRNTRKLYAFAGRDLLAPYYSREKCDVASVIKPKGVGLRYVTDRIRQYPHYWYRVRDAFPFPEEPWSPGNVLLTSDGYFKTAAEADALYLKYRPWWHLFTLFQLPHHGSSLNSDIELLSRLPSELGLFVNFGTRHAHSDQWSHPSDELIEQIRLTRGIHDLILINEFEGLLINNWI